MYYIHTDFTIAIPITIGIGSYQTITNELGQVVEKLSFDPRSRANPFTWESKYNPDNFPTLAPATNYLPFTK